MFFKLQHENGKKANYITRYQLANIFDVAFGLPESILTRRMFLYLVGTPSSRIPVESWVKMMNIFLRGTVAEKIHYCYAVYDPKNQGIKRDQMVVMTRALVFKVHHGDYVVKGLVDLILEKMDKDRDGVITFEEYEAAVKRHPMLMECLGQCLPDIGYVAAFLTTFTDTPKKF